MNLEDVARWKECERRARERGWTIDLLVAKTGAAEAAIGGQPIGKREFVLKELYGNERALATGDLDTIAAFLERPKDLAGLSRETAGQP